jgi:soluble lytic murein transglycosylase-like protein
MAALIAFAVASASLPPVPNVSADLVGRWSAIIHEAAGRAAIPEAWICRVIRAESGGRTMLAGRQITSGAGAMGLMQLMPATWGEMRGRLGLGTDPFDPHDNIVAGAAFLRLMYDRFGYPGLFGAYNAGPGRYAASLKGRALPAETIDYLAKVTGGGIPSRVPVSAGALQIARRPGLFVAIQGSALDAGQASKSADLLFAVRREPTTESAPVQAPGGGE